MSPIWLIVALLAIVAGLLLVSSVRTLRSRHLFGGLTSLLVAALLAAVAALAATAAWAFSSFDLLTRETVAATVRIEPVDGGEARFRAHVRIPGHEDRTFEISGDQIYVDARIVKWHPWASALGLPTAYRLDRIGGRYRSIDDEQTQPRTVTSLASDSPRLADDLFDAVAGRSWLEPLVDARYGSGTFTTASTARTVEIRVSTSGLVTRPIEPTR